MGRLTAHPTDHPRVGQHPSHRLGRAWNPDRGSVRQRAEWEAWTRRWLRDDAQALGKAGVPAIHRVQLAFNVGTTAAVSRPRGVRRCDAGHLRTRVRDLGGLLTPEKLGLRA